MWAGKGIEWEHSEWEWKKDNPEKDDVIKPALFILLYLWTSERDKWQHISPLDIETLSIQFLNLMSLFNLYTLPSIPFFDLIIECLNWQSYAIQNMSWKLCSVRTAPTNSNSLVITPNANISSLTGTDALPSFPFFCIHRNPSVFCFLALS